MGERVNWRKVAESLRASEDAMASAKRMHPAHATIPAVAEVVFAGLARAIETALEPSDG